MNRGKLERLLNSSSPYHVRKLVEQKVIKSPKEVEDLLTLKDEDFEETETNKKQ